MNEAHLQLDPRIQRWIYNQGWPELRDIQQRAISPILAEDRDVLISASTAAGKTEAFFLPACSAVADQSHGISILYVGPLKALISDQYRRLESLCAGLNLPVTPWHGDSGASQKKQAVKQPKGILLITPESLESMLIRKHKWVQQAFANLRYIVIDEFHTFIGNERGQQLLSLLNRLEHMLGRHSKPIPRVGLSATLSDIKSVPLSLRPNQSLPCELIVSPQSQGSLKVQVRGYIEPPKQSDAPLDYSADDRICRDIYQLCRGGSHLVFTNSRQRSESITSQLNDRCERDIVPNEFFPHHGSLSKHLREEVEARLVQEKWPTTAVCTTTLELGIDIGQVHSVIQVGAPYSVSSLRQRAGRSGRRNESAILRMLIAEDEIIGGSGIIDRLRMELVQSLAMVRLLVANKWFEPANQRHLHLSTLLHQVLATTAQWGGIRADQLYALLCLHGPFQNVTVQQFKALLSHLAATDMLTQLSSGEITLGCQGERLVNHYSFIVTFKSPGEYRIIHNGKTLGTVPVSAMIKEDQYIVFGGRSWKVLSANAQQKELYVEPALSGKPPRFSRTGISIHQAVRQEMLTIYQSGDYGITTNEGKMDFANREARALFEEGVYHFNAQQLHEKTIISEGGHTYIFSWTGDDVANTLAAMLMLKGFKVSTYAGVVEIKGVAAAVVYNALKDLLRSGTPSDTDLAQQVVDRDVEKFDQYVPNDLLTEGYGMRTFNAQKTSEWIATACR